MALVNSKELLKDAKSKKYTVGAFNITTLEAVRGVIDAAEEERSPVIIEFAEVHSNIIPLSIIGPIMVRAAKESNVPVVVHFDHGKDIQLILEALKMGFTSVMIDGADLPYGENIEVTKKVVEMAREFGATVEGELGFVMDADSIHDKDAVEDFYTDPKIARDFVEQTGVDSLAVSFGTAHGLYVKKPNLDYERLKNIAKEVPVPLVMHGGSGLSNKEYAECISKGICKINYYSDLANRVAKELSAKLIEKKEKGIETYMHDISTWAIEIIKKDVASKMKVFGSPDQFKRGEE